MVQIPAGPAPKQVIFLTVHFSCFYMLASSIFLVHVMASCLCVRYRCSKWLFCSQHCSVFKPLTVTSVSYFLILC
jgi:hypothetical protein